MKSILNEKIVENFNQASFQYNNEATIQKTIATLLATKCLKQAIPPGFWLDLGTGTGLLANSLEKLNPSQSVVRVDLSKLMLEQHPKKSAIKLWDLNLGLPNDFSQPPNLIASNFALHWLNRPTTRLKEWFSALSPGGWLALAVPIKGSFTEWYQAASFAKVNCTAMDFPSNNSLIETLGEDNIRYQKIERITQSSLSVNSLLKPFIKMGAQATHHKPLKISEWKRLNKNWPICKNTSKKNLTWLVQILLAQK